MEDGDFFDGLNPLQLKKYRDTVVRRLYRLPDAIQGMFSGQDLNIQTETRLLVERCKAVQWDSWF